MDRFIETHKFQLGPHIAENVVPSLTVTDAEATLAPVDFVGASMLATAGAAIGQSVNIQVKRGWNEPPLLFGIIVAPPGKTKSPVVPRRGQAPDRDRPPAA